MLYLLLWEKRDSRRMRTRLPSVGADWSRVSACFLTRMYSDIWHARQQPVFLSRNHMSLIMHVLYFPCMVNIIPS